MAQLSSRAQALLARGRRQETLTQPDEIVGYLTKAGLPVFEPVVSAQAQFGGIDYRDRGVYDGFHFDLFKGYNRQDDWELVTHQDSMGRWYFDCGDFPYAQCFILLSQDGTVCEEEAYFIRVPLASSVEKLIESDAMLEEWMDSQSRWWTISCEIPQYDRAIDAIFARNLPTVAEASDAYTTWWADDQARVVRHPMMSPEPIDRITAYLPSLVAANRLDEAVRQFNGTSLSVYSLPFEIREHRRR